MEGTVCSPENPCSAVQVLVREQLRQGEDITDLRKDVKSLQNRLPTWAVAVISTLTAACGFLAK